MTFKLVAIFESGPTCEVTDKAIRGAVARWFQGLAAEAASSAGETPTLKSVGDFNDHDTDPDCASSRWVSPRGLMRSGF
jgi:hypothetical protein